MSKMRGSITNACSSCGVSKGTPLQKCACHVPLGASVQDVHSAVLSEEEEESLPRRLRPVVRVIANTATGTSFSTGCEVLPMTEHAAFPPLS